MWNDPWILRAKNFKPFRRRNAPPNVNKVSQLMLDNLRRWKSKLLNRLFKPQDVRLIKAIPLSQRNFQDSNYCKFGSKGTYLV